MHDMQHWKPASESLILNIFLMSPTGNEKVMWYLVNNTAIICFDPYIGLKLLEKGATVQLFYGSFIDIINTINKIRANKWMRNQFSDGEITLSV